MLENFIYSTKINESELLKTISLRGHNVFAIRFVNLNELVDDANIKLGFAVKNKVLSSKQIEERVLNFFISVVNLSTPSYGDVKHFLKTLNDIRNNIVDLDELSKLSEIVKLHPTNNNLLKLENFTKAYFDSLGDDIDLIKFARLVVEASLKQGKKLYSKIKYIKEENISLFEKFVLESLADEVEAISLFDLFESNKVSNKISSINPRYGTRNEVANVIADILKGKKKQEECLIVLANKSGYINELVNFKNEFNLNMTFECGLPIQLSNSYKLYALLKNLENKYFYDVHGYLNLFKSKYFDLAKLGIDNEIHFAQLLGRMKICFDKSKNDEYLRCFNNLRENNLDILELFIEKIDMTIYKKDQPAFFDKLVNIINEFSKGIAYVIENYALFDKEDSFELAANKFICDTLNYASGDALPEELKESYLSTIDSKYLGSKVFDENSIHVTTLDKAISSVRNNVYILGLNASNIPGSNVEDFLFSDDNYFELCGIKNITENKLQNNNEFLRTLINTFVDLGVNLKLSYNCQEISEPRELNACSVLLDFADEFFKEDNQKLKESSKKYTKFDELKKNCSYYDDGLSVLSEYEKIAIDSNNKITAKSPIITQKLDSLKDSKGVDLLSKAFAPSTIYTFHECPLNYYLKNLLRIDDEIDYDPANPIAANRFGDIYHFVMEMFIKHMSNASEDELVSYAEKIYDLYTSLDRSIGDNNKYKNDLIDCVKKGRIYLLENFDVPTGKPEESIGYNKDEDTSLNGVKFHGSIDLVIRDKNGKLVILDYKTGENIKHDPQDNVSCMQGLIYSQVYEKLHGEEVSKLIFYYPKKGHPVEIDSPCDLEKKQFINEKIAVFKNALLNKHFETVDDIEQCSALYCKFADICHIQDKLNKEED